MFQYKNKQDKAGQQDTKPRKNRLILLYFMFSVSILALGGIFLNDIVKGRNMENNLSEAVKEFKKQVNNGINETSNPVKDSQPKIKNYPEVIKTNGFTVLGIISVPSRGIEYPILKEKTDEALKVSVCQIAGDDLNTSGNVSLAGHNMRNGKLFAQIRYLKNGSQIKITDGKGITLTYTVLKKFKVDPTDVSVMKQNMDGRKIITLITCTADGNERLIVQAEAVE